MHGQPHIRLANPVCKRSYFFRYIFGRMCGKIIPRASVQQKMQQVLMYVFLLFNTQLGRIELSRLLKSRFRRPCTLKAFTCFYSEVHKSFVLYILRFPTSRLVPPVLTIHIIIIIHVSWSWATCWPVPVSRIQ